MIMGGSSESVWHRSDNSRGLNISAVSNRIPNRSSFSGDASLESGLIPLPARRLDQSKSQVGSSAVCEDELPADSFVPAIEWGEVSLRQWLDKTERCVDALECLCIFRQIVEIVNAAHSQGIVVQNVRPSCFVMSSFNHVSFIESASCSDSGSDSLEDGENNKTEKERRRDASCGVPETGSVQLKQLYGTSALEAEERDKTSRNVEQGEEDKFPMKQILIMERNWYTSPEEATGGPSSCSSDIYRLGVLLFELFCTFSSREEKNMTMSSLRHRVLPPSLLLKWPKEASFCLWLLHPEPSCRPAMSELLGSDFLNEPRENLEVREAAMELQEKIEQQDQLLEFLLLLQQRKQDVADKLQSTISFLSSDVEEVMRRQTLLKIEGNSTLEPGSDNHSTTDTSSINVVEVEDSETVSSRKRLRPILLNHDMEELDHDSDAFPMSETQNQHQESILSKNSRLMKNFKKLELAYFMTRCKPSKASTKTVIGHSPVRSGGKGSIAVTERSSVNNVTSNEQSREGRQDGWINPFLGGLCKYLSFNKLKVRADLKQGDLLNSSNLVCSLSFDRDGEFFATAGVNRKIKVFECDAILNEERDIHYPVVEMTCRSKLSSTCWNSYIKSQIASSNFEGVVQIWDVTRSQVLTAMTEHERRVWSIDFSSADPTLLASGSDDGSVKLWSINQGVSVNTIKTKANVCSVQFPLDSARFLAFGSADHRIYYYDLRNTRLPLCTILGHTKTVSYVKFVDSTNLVSASTDNTLKVWDLAKCDSRVDSPLQAFTGHMNVKNFVGLSVSDGYIATGSETNEVFIYHKAFPMPMMSFKFNSMDLFSGRETDDAAQFISSVCWRGQSSTLVAANSAGNIKILEMV